ncbi:beta strand repeat-containing protein [Baaleninema simplex]|uniref:beta strand repeat-containing protein n=1 Tax=Baaleninema simplex TaxID=2862350 RepID=UPI0003694318|nr:S-layer family protein [Baaleninema simplex]
MLAKPTFAQIVPDNTLPASSQVTLEDNRYSIEGGTTVGGNLFHSFQSFSVPTEAEAFFNNALAIENIISRVTGNQLSAIDGLIRANGTANVFLINPNGLRFGANARLDIGGSFLGSTAESLQLSDGSFYSAVNPQAPSLLTVSVPVGLQLGTSPGAIQVEGNGHGLTVGREVRLVPIDRSQVNEGLQVRSGNTLALIGGEINFVGGVLRTPEGRVALGSARSGNVSLASSEAGWMFSYEGVEGFGNIHLSERAAVDASGLGMGSIQMVGQQVRLTDGSIALIQNQGSKPSGELSIRASDVLAVVGANPEQTFPSLLVSETLQDGAGGEIEIATRELLALDGGTIVARTFGAASSGNVSIGASESVQIGGFISKNPNLYSFLVSITGGEGNSGNLTIDTQALTVFDGGTLNVSSIDIGRGGNIVINASESVTMSGIISETMRPTAIASATINETDAGTITINTSRLAVRDGATISTSTGASGAAGRITINATESVEVIGNRGRFLARVQSDGVIFPEATRQALGLFSTSGNSGNITIHTPRLIVSEGGIVSVGNEGTGSAGNLQIDADSILLLDTEAGISAITASGEGGNITLTTDFLQLRRNSQISTEAGGSGNGGNLNIEARTIVALEGSDINANAFEGSGGNVRITTEGIFLSPESEITASSQLGVDGIVEITNPEIDTNAAFVQLSSNPIDPATQMVSACDVAAENTFVVTGNGGLPPDPTEVLHGRTVWEDIRLTEIRDSSVESENEERSPATELDSSQLPLVEATGWQWRNDGTIELVAAPQNRMGNRWLESVRCSDR